MILFPLAIVAGVFAARRWPLRWALLLGAMLFGAAVVVSWQVQGYEPSARDFVWLVAVVVATWISARSARRRR